MEAIFWVNFQPTVLLRFTPPPCLPQKQGGPKGRSSMEGPEAPLKQQINKQHQGFKATYQYTSTFKQMIIEPKPIQIKGRTNAKLGRNSGLQ